MGLFRTLLDWLVYWALLVVYSVPFVRRRLIPGVPYALYKNYCTTSAWKIIWNGYVYERDKVVYKGGPAYNADVVSMDGQPMKMFDFVRTGRPLVVNFGSAT